MELYVVTENLSLSPPFPLFSQLVEGRDDGSPVYRTSIFDPGCTDVSLTLQKGGKIEEGSQLVEDICFVTRITFDVPLHSTLN